MVLANGLPIMTDHTSTGVCSSRTCSFCSAWTIFIEYLLPVALAVAEGVQWAPLKSADKKQKQTPLPILKIREFSLLQSGSSWP